MDDREVVAVGTECPMCGEAFFMPEPKHSELIQDLVRAARAAKTIHNMAEYDTKHERPGYYIHSDAFHWFGEALKDVEDLP
jgi:hypothetical protein